MFETVLVSIAINMQLRIDRMTEIGADALESIRGAADAAAACLSAATAGTAAAAAVTGTAAAGTSPAAAGPAAGGVFCVVCC